MRSFPSVHRPGLSRLLTRALVFPAGRRVKFVVLVAWVALAALAVPLAAGLGAAKDDRQSGYLPGASESVRALRASERFPSGEVAAAVVVYRRRGGLTAADRAVIAADRHALTAHPPPRATAPAAARIAPDRTTAILAVPIRRTADAALAAATEEIRATVAPRAAGLVVRLTGPAGFAADSAKVGGSTDMTLLLAAAALVLVLLVAVYRSPIFWAIPFAAVLVAELCSQALGTLLARAGATVTTQSVSILTVLVFGAATDYALLLVARYREELRRHEDTHAAMRSALRRAGPSLVASGLTVAGALLCLSAARLDSTAALGPIGALGIALALVAMLTLLPALLLLAGRRAFWPAVPRLSPARVDAHRRWTRLGEGIARRPRRTWVAATCVLGVMAAGLVDLNANLTSTSAYRTPADSVAGQRLVAEAFPAGTSAPTSVIVARRSRVAAVRQAVIRTPGVAAVGPVERGAPGARFDVTLTPSPTSLRAFALIPGLRDAARAAGGRDVLVGGPTAQEHDVRVAVDRDLHLLVPVVLTLVLAGLCVLLRAVIAPLLLLATVIASFAAALGAGSFLFETVLGFPGIDPTVPLFAFVFLVALGIDYNIFLAARVREEARRHGTREGTIRGLAATGAVITSAGVALAGTFLTLAVLPLYQFTEIGLVIALGVLLDTFLVRSVLVPALLLDIGSRVWWPSALARGHPDDERRGYRACPPVQEAW